jgi:hypothetical protein
MPDFSMETTKIILEDFSNPRSHLNVTKKIIDKKYCNA